MTERCPKCLLPVTPPRMICPQRDLETCALAVSKRLRRYEIVSQRGLELEREFKKP